MNDSAPRVLVVVLSYNKRDLVLQCIASLVRQRDSGARRLVQAATKNPLARHSYAYNFIVSNAIVAAGEIRGPAQAQQIDFGFRLSFPDAEIPLNTTNVDADEVAYAKRLRSGDVNLDVFGPGLEAFMELAREWHFHPLVAYMPAAHNVYSEEIVFDDPSLAELMPWVHRTQLQYFREKANELGYSFLDLTPPLREAARSGGSQHLLYMADDLHLTPRAHRVVAEALSETIASLRPPPREAP